MLACLQDFCKDARQVLSNVRRLFTTQNKELQSGRFNIQSKARSYNQPPNPVV